MSRGGVFDMLPGRRALLLPIMLAHVGVVAWMATQRSEMPAPRAASSLTMFDVAAAPPAPAPAPEVVRKVAQTVAETPPVPDLPTIASPPVVLAATTLPEAPDGMACDLTATVQAAIRASGSAHVALASLPASARSVANAVMLWDGRWIEGRSTAASFAFERLRRVVRETVAQASPECQRQTQAGPRLIAIPGPPDTVLAIGSGRWRWSDLAAEPSSRAPQRPLTLILASLDTMRPNLHRGEKP